MYIEVINWDDRISSSRQVCKLRTLTPGEWECLPSEFVLIFRANCASAKLVKIENNSQLDNFALVHNVQPLHLLTLTPPQMWNFSQGLTEHWFALCYYAVEVSWVTGRSGKMWRCTGIMCINTAWVCSSQCSLAVAGCSAGRWLVAGQHPAPGTGAQWAHRPAAARAALTAAVLQTLAWPPTLLALVSSIVLYL